MEQERTRRRKEVEERDRKARGGVEGETGQNANHRSSPWHRLAGALSGHWGLPTYYPSWGKWEFSTDLTKSAFWKQALDSSKNHFSGSSLFSKLAKLSTIHGAANRQILKIKFKKN